MAALDMTNILVQYMTMIRINIHEAKTHLSRYLARLQKGEVILICRRNIPVAELRAVPTARTRKRPLGLARDEFQVPESFFIQLPEEVLQGFEGQP